jgi:3-hydroxyacyl-[acyl-carrier-protein] dehydratase
LKTEFWQWTSAALKSSEQSRQNLIQGNGDLILMRFILVDRILSIEPGKSATAEKSFSEDEELFRDHFPGFAVVPGVLLTEMMGQTAAKCLDCCPSDRGKAILASIRKAEFREWVRPGELVVMSAEIRTDHPKMAVAMCSAKVDERNVASAELLFSFLPDPGSRQSMPDPVLEAYFASRGDGRSKAEY